MPASSYLLAAALVLVAGCSASHGADATAGPDTGGADASLRSDSGPIGMDVAPSSAPPSVCGLTTCATGQICCFTSLTCFDPATPSACPRPVDGGIPGPPACASNADCAATEICETELAATGGISGRCGGQGICAPRRPPDDCGPSGDGVCGCDGHTYPTQCDASLQGVRTATMYPCGARAYPAPDFRFPCPGDCLANWHCDLAASECVPDYAVYGCGVGGACPAATTCCPTLGLCLDSTRPDLCRLPPDGTSFPCADNSDCAVLAEGPAPAREYCVGADCSGPGGCVLPEGRCSGVLTPVCGCDGMPYTNACWAASARVRVAHERTCP